MAGERTSENLKTARLNDRTITETTRWWILNSPGSFTLYCVHGKALTVGCAVCARPPDRVLCGPDG